MQFQGSGHNTTCPITFNLWTLSLRHYLTSQFWGWWLWYVECSYQTLFTDLLVYVQFECTTWTPALAKLLRAWCWGRNIYCHANKYNTEVIEELNTSHFDIPSGHPNVYTDTLPTNSHKHNFWFVANLKTKIHYAFSCWIVAIAIASILVAFEQNL